MESRAREVVYGSNTQYWSRYSLTVMRFRMDSYLTLAVEIAERLLRNFEVGARSATESINELMPSHAPLGSLKRPNAGFGFRELQGRSRPTCRISLAKITRK